jgi:anti-anti-sigma factor
MDRGGQNTWKLLLSEEEANGLRILVLNGRLGYAAAPSLANALASPTAGHGLILDISGVDYISSAALTVLQDYARAHPPLVIAGACDTVKLTIEFSGMGAGLTLVPSRAAALAQLRRD